MDLFEKIRTIAQKDRNEFLDDEINKGKKVIGYFCSYFPEELIHAAGFIPYRMRAVASNGTSRGDVYFSSLNCTFVRRCFDKILEGHFDFLDGIVFMNSCDHIRRMYDNARYAETDLSFMYMFVIPHTMNDLALDRYTQEIMNFKTEFEKHFHVIITDDSLRESVKLYNRKRSLIKQINESRKNNTLTVKASELLDTMLAVTMMPVEKSIDLLEQVLEKTSSRNISADNELRIFLLSGCMEETAHLELIESLGGAVVADSICLGQRYYDMQVEESGDLYSNLADRYLRHMSCPRMMDDFRRRLSYMNSCLNEYSVDAVIAEKLKFCDLWGGEIYLHKQDARQKGIPLIALERELYGSGDGQIATRIQAFFEQVRNIKKHG